MRGGRAAVLTTVSAALLVLLVGCTAGPPVPEQTFPQYTPTSTPTPPPTVAPVAVPVRPADMERTDEVGAAAAATYFMELYHYVLMTGDHEEWDRLGIDDCRFCRGTSEKVAQIYGSGGRIVGGDMTLGAPEVLGVDPTLGVFEVRVPSEFAAGSENDVVGEVVEAYEPEDLALVLELIHSAPGWTLVGGYVGDADDV